MEYEKIVQNVEEKMLNNKNENVIGGYVKKTYMELVEEIFTPAALPCSACWKLADCTSFKLSPLMETTEPVTDSFLWVPYPITTTSSNCWVSSANCTLSVDWPFTAIV